ncbi:Cys-Gln thioester bond-forming surface protein [Kitasatospora aureofaciens]|uniref:Cys-Gln thioester bond-forming surface protein n=1 Tax=Kitasatospora aureofaciens TaxID=1894 RepID=UPI001C440015|nr:Cys-Gln thioester bond-forming surface protein [Kitasatospora aureofaciens]MBV6697632.1 Cys-Gln thioester bond-forming surface protein [Kitasatospora aureofaciens]
MLTTSLALGGGLLAAGAAAAAAPGAGVTAVVENTMLGEKIDVDGGSTVEGGLFTLKTSSGELQTYCIDFGNPVYLDSQAKYQESDWKSSSLGRKDKAQDASKIRWILENSYPQVTDLEKLSKDAAVDGQLSKEDAAAGTQAAIWKFSDGKDAVPQNSKARQLRDYLIGDKNKGIAAEPKPSLTLAPDVSGKSGSKLGPFTLNSSAGQVKLAVNGNSADKIKVLDKDGKPVGDALNGPIAKDTQLFLDVPAGTPDGGAVLTASAETVVPSGRVFLSEGYTPEKHSQTMILAGSSKLSVSANAKANWKQGKGALIDSIAQVECENSGVRVSVANGGDEAATVTVKPGKDLTVQPGKTESLLLTVANKAAYDITVTGPNGYTNNFKGILDCKSATTPVTPSSGPSTPGASGAPTTPAGTPSKSSSTAPAPAVTSSAPGTGGLAQTGASSNTPILAGVAGALVIAGGAAVFFLRRRGRHGGNAA